MDNKIRIAYLIPIFLFIFKNMLGLLIYVPILVIMFLISYYYMPEKNSDWRNILGLYGLNFFILILGFIIYSLY